VFTLPAHGLNGAGILGQAIPPGGIVNLGCRKGGGLCGAAGGLCCCGCDIRGGACCGSVMLADVVGLSSAGGWVDDCCEGRELATEGRSWNPGWDLLRSMFIAAAAACLVASSSS
jgi:hypothetical protein